MRGNAGRWHRHSSGPHCRRRCCFTRYRSAAGAIAHVPAAQLRAMHMSPPRIGIGGHDGTADACGVWRGALQCSMRIRHKGLRALHERDHPAAGACRSGATA